GYGDTGLEPYPENLAGTRHAPDFKPLYKALATQSAAALRFVRRQPHVRASQILLTGQSMGGVAVTAHLGQGAKGVVGGINFAGALAYNRSVHTPQGCCIDDFRAAMRRFGGRATAPMLWVFGRGDTFVPSMDEVQHRFDIFRKAHLDSAADARSRLHVVSQQTDLDGHFIIAKPQTWQAAVDRFTASVGLRRSTIAIAAR
ncbi:MAG: hypothetical protein AAGG72_09895, partial [Pseudomonadota bacterium]